MLKYLLIIFLCLGSGGCVSYQYIGIYNYALRSKTTTVITKEGNLNDLRQRDAGYFEARGYKKLIYQDPKSGLFVFYKSGDFNEPCQIILKYTLKPAEGGIRVDLVKASDDLITDSQVSLDIQDIAQQIRNY
jgi:hypothetical protein